MGGCGRQSTVPCREGAKFSNLTRILGVRLGNREGGILRRIGRFPDRKRLRLRGNTEKILD